MTPPQTRKPAPFDTATSIAASPREKIYRRTRWSSAGMNTHWGTRGPGAGRRGTFGVGRAHVMQPNEPEVGSGPPAIRVVATTILKADARARLSEQLGPGFVVIDLRKAPPSTDIVIAPVVSAQTISALKHMFPHARVVLTEVEDRDLGVLFPGPVRRAVDAGADGYVVAGDLAALADFAVSDHTPALNPGQPGQLNAASVRKPSSDEAVMHELDRAQSRRRAIQ